MASSCCVVGCTNRYTPATQVKFYYIPRLSHQRQSFIKAINRKDWTPNDSTRICSVHFKTGSISPDMKDVDYAPTVFEHRKEHSQIRLSARLQEKKLNTLLLSTSGTPTEDTQPGEKCPSPVPSTMAPTIPQTTSVHHSTVAPLVFNALIIPSTGQPNIAKPGDAKAFSQLSFNQLFPRVVGMLPRPGSTSVLKAVMPPGVIGLRNHQAKQILIKAPVKSIPASSALLQLLLSSSHSLPKIDVPPTVSKQVLFKPEPVPSEEQRFQAQSLLLQATSVGFPESICEQQLLEDSVNVPSSDLNHDAVVEKDYVNVSSDQINRIKFTHAEEPMQKVSSASKELSLEDDQVDDTKDGVSVENTRDESTGKPKCKTCGKVFSTSASVRRHQAIHSDERKFKCDICCKTFRWENSLQFHVKMHNSCPGFTCHFCGVWFPKASALKTHTILKHPSKSALVCDICQMRCLNESEFTWHRNQHRVSGNYCDKTPTERFRFYEQLAIQANEKTCEVCGAIIADGSPLHSHCLFDSKEISCDICGMTVANGRVLKRHMRKCLENCRTFECTICNRKYFTNLQLDKHMLKHTANKPFKCNECSKTYRSRTTLKGHYDGHRGIMPYSCQYCSRKFLFQANKQKHEKRHTGIKDFRCVSCSKCFYEKQELQRHVTRSHTPSDILSDALPFSVIALDDPSKTHILSSESE